MSMDVPIFFEQITKLIAKNKAKVSTWNLPTYLDTMDSFRLVIGIKHLDEPWDQLFF